MYRQLLLAILVPWIFVACTSNDPGSSTNGTNLDGGTQDAASDTSLPPGCTNATQDGTETDVDCGGSTCPACAETLRCITGADCESTVCRVGKCAAATCNDNVLNQDESDSDCGGTTCSGCGNGRNCGEHSDCLSGLCSASGTCANSCPDGEVNGSETDVDCGGSGCMGCADGKMCVEDSDCADNACSPSGICVAHCTSLTKDSNETDVDCGGPDCDPCPDLDACLIPSDCQSGVCTANVCQVPTCTDNVHNGTETDVDCGGPCSPCVDGQMCSAGSDCTSMVCDMGTCGAAGCTDNMKNGTETDVDCGGSGCSPCDPGDMCLIGSDCTSTICIGNQCTTPSCTDGIKNGDETGLDCGGSCGPCPDGVGCNLAQDCQSGVCTGNLCQVPTCTDGVANGSESDLDCGGSCEACADGLMCSGPSDCDSGVCASNICQIPTCTDGITNGDESDMDCGGVDCAGCPGGSDCRWRSDCEKNVCENHICTAITYFQSCMHQQLAGGSTISGTYTIQPDPMGTARQVFCDMDNDGGGWTLVSKAVDYPVDAEAGSYRTSIASYNHTGGSSWNIWDGMRPLATYGDIRFTCYESTSSNVSIADPLDVDLSFYTCGWYGTMTSNTNSALVNIKDPGKCSRKNNLTGATRYSFDSWNNTPNSSGAPRMENFVNDNAFKLDFDDSGVGGTVADGTDWGYEGGVGRICGSAYTYTAADPMWYIYVRENSVPNVCNANGAKDNSETDVDCGGGNCPLCAQGNACLVDSDCTSLNCTNDTCD